MQLCRGLHVDRLVSQACKQHHSSVKAALMQPNIGCLSQLKAHGGAAAAPLRAHAGRRRHRLVGADAGMLRQYCTQQQQRQLPWTELYEAAAVAKWSGFCYKPYEQLEQSLQQPGQRLTLVAHGRSEYTSWYVADGRLDHQHFAAAAAARRAPSAANGGSSSSPQPSPLASLDVPDAPARRYVFLRGVQWSAPDMDVVKMWSGLARAWPEPFAPEHTRHPDTLVAHSGVAAMVQSLLPQLAPYLEGAAAAGLPICFAGHSLGGSLAKLLMAQAALGGVDGMDAGGLSCFTYGSPPVLAHERGGGGARVLALLRVPPQRCRNFVLQNDPVPRAMLSVDPTFAAIKTWGPVKQLLSLRGLLLGSGSILSPERFLYETVGEVYLVRWHHTGGCEVVPLDAHEIERELSLPPDWTSQVNLVRSMQAMLDHMSGSYGQELEAAAIKELRRTMGRIQQSSAPGTTTQSGTGTPTLDGSHAGGLGMQQAAAAGVRSAAAGVHTAAASVQAIAAAAADGVALGGSQAAAVVETTLEGRATQPNDAATVT